MTTEEVEAKLQSDSSASAATVWWKGQDHWIDLTQWRQNRSTIMSQRDANGVAHKQFYFNDGSENTEGPLSIEAIGERIKGMTDLDMIRLWAADKKRWKTIFEFRSVCEQLGLTRRSHPRAPLAGTATLSKEDVQMTATVTSVSIGGFGVLLDTPTTLTGEYSVILRSPSFFNMIKAKADVAYTKHDGSIGFKFQNLNGENQAAILEYIRNFESEMKSVEAA
jgi:hypothetical protein